jgi:hypothetical protein
VLKEGEYRQIMDSVELPGEMMKEYRYANKTKI